MTKKLCSAEPQIAAAICTYNRYDVLPSAIGSLAQQTLTLGQYKVLVIDNSPDHERAHAFGKRYQDVPNLTYVIEEAPGLSNARNVAARLCGTAIIAFMDDDAIASPGWLAEVLNAFEMFGPRTMIVGGRVSPIWGAPRPPWLDDSMLGNLSVVDYGNDLRVAEPSEWFAGTNISFRTDAILSKGGFATNLGRIGSGAALLSNEEVHLVERIRSAGGKLIYAPKAHVEHLAEPTRLTRSWFRRRSTWQAISDFTMDATRFTAEAKNYWKETIGYFHALPPYERTIRGLLHDTDDPKLFRWQLGAIYMLTMMMLAGFEGVSLD